MVLNITLWLPCLYFLGCVEEGPTEDRDFFNMLVILKEDSASWRRITSGNMVDKIYASVKLQGTINVDETKMISVK